MEEINYSVVDVETTGFSPQRGDRIVEIGVTRLNSQFQIEGTFETLINPKRDVGPTSIHGITAEMVCQAPVFSEVVPALLEFVDGSIIVAHNASFDIRFLNKEIERAGYEGCIVRHICTLELARNHIFELPSLKLPSLCAYLGINLKEQHCALADSEATATLLSILAQEFGALESIDNAYAFRSPVGKPAVGKLSYLTRNSFATKSTKHESPLASLLNRLPTAATQDAGAVAYSELLDRVLMDRIVSAEEADALFELAESLGLSRTQVMDVHAEYLKGLVRIALIDGVITNIEYMDLGKIGQLLSIESGELDRIIDQQKADKTTSIPIKAPKSYIGKSVCFTGELRGTINAQPITRDLAHRLSMERGLVIRKGVTKDLDYLVVADPNTQSSKAQKARDYGVNIISECAYWTLIGLQVE